MDRYSHVVGGMDREAADQVAALILGGKPERPSREVSFQELHLETCSQVVVSLQIHKQVCHRRISLGQRPSSPRAPERSQRDSPAALVAVDLEERRREALLQVCTKKHGKRG